MRVLIVEDEPDLLSALRRTFEDQGYAVDVAADGVDALFKATSWAYDCVVLDLMLPEMDGWTVLEKLRQESAAPVLVLTARAGVDDRVRGLDAGADDYLVKPFELTELLARVRALIRRSAGRPDPRIEVGEIVVDTVARRIERDGKEVHLTAREYALVEMLVLHRGELVTRSDLYDHLFDENDPTFSNTIDVHVSNVRKKLGHEFIVTRRGHGYMVGVAPGTDHGADPDPDRDDRPGSS